jgi:hypothetical protein
MTANDGGVYRGIQMYTKVYRCIQMITWGKRGGEGGKGDGEVTIYSFNLFFGSPFFLFWVG